jgi:hypothetical protein
MLQLVGSLKGAAMFQPLPESFPSIEAIATRLAAGSRIRAIPDTRSMARRLRDAYARARVDGYRSLRRNEYRKLPYAYFLNGEPSLVELHPALVQRYWEKAAAQMVGRASSANRWLTPLLHVYCSQFDSQGGDFRALAEGIAAVLREARGPVSQTLQRLQSELYFLEPAAVARNIAADAAGRGGSADSWRQGRNLPEGFFVSKLGAAAFREMLRLPIELRRDTEVVRVILSWASSQNPKPPAEPLRVPFADALLGPWVQRNPEENLRRELVHSFTRSDSYGDPRLRLRAAYQWSGVSEPALSVIKRWLAGDTLRAFVQILERTADEIWEYRQKFWMAYFERGYIDDAWLALGDKAMREFRRDYRGGGRACGSLSGAMHNQSVLLLKLGDLVFQEWSHDGSLRAYKEGSRECPTLYQTEYTASDLRGRRSLNLHPRDSENMYPQLRHFRSAEGGWQRKARDFIRRETGVYLTDQEILL